MSSLTIETAPKSKRVETKQRSGEEKARSLRKSKPAPAIANAPPKIDAPAAEGRVTKQEHVLTLLSRPDGASIDELMQATDWQQHSVRGFLAGTVKKKLGLTLTSSKTIGEVRRYRIEKRRSR